MSNDIPTRKVAGRETAGTDATDQSGAVDQSDAATRRVGTDATGAHGVPTAQNSGDAPTRHVNSTIDVETETGDAATTTHGRPAPRRRPLGGLAAGAILCGDCEVIGTWQNHETERPGLFECHAPEGRVMVKIAAVEYPPNHELWTKLTALRHRNVLRVFRTVEEEGRFYEVQEFCAGGTLAGMVPAVGSGRPTPPTDWIENVLVPAFAAGIDYLHEYGIVHRDIKPSNIYLRQQAGSSTIVLGDFDISATLDLGRTSRSTQRAAGTWNYSAPEAFPRFMDEAVTQVGSALSRASDYYSFGVVLVELLTGTTSLHQALFPDLFDFYLQGGRVEIPTGLSPRLTELLHGLLLRNRNLRWGRAEVGRWLAYTTTEDDRRRIRDDGGYRFGVASQPFNAFEHSKPTTLRELAEAMQREPGLALEELMSGDVLLNWIGHLDPRLARQIRRNREQWRSIPQMVAIYTGTQLAPDLPWPLWITTRRKANNAMEWVTEATAAVKEKTVSAADLCGIPGLTLLETWLRNKSEPESDMADAVRAIRTRGSGSGASRATPGAMPPIVVLEELSYAFSASKAYLVAPGVVARTPREIVRKIYGEPKDWQGRGSSPSSVYLAAHKRWLTGSLEAWLRQRVAAAPEGERLVEQCTSIRTKFADAPFAGFETVLRLLDPDLPPIQVTLDVSPLRSLLLADRDRNLTITLSYRTEGPGIPYGAWRLENHLPGLQIVGHQVNSRAGELTVRLESANQIPANQNHRASLSLEGKLVTLKPEKVELNYRVKQGFKLNPVFFQARLLRAVGIFAANIFFLAYVVRLFCEGWLAQPVILRGHSGSISSVAFSPNGKNVFTGSADGNAKIWRADMQPDAVNWTTFLTILSEMSSDDDKIREESSNLSEGTAITSMSVAPNGQWVALGHADNVIRIWKLNSAKPSAGRLTGNGDRYNEIETLNFSHDGELLASGYRNGTIELWNTSNWTKAWTWVGHTGAYAGVKHVEFSPDDSMLASASDDSTTALWFSPQGQKYADFEAESEWCRAAAFAPKEPLLAMGNDAHVLHIFNWRTKKAVGAFTYHTGNILALSFSPDGKLLASAGADGVLAFWDTASWQVKYAIREATGVTSLAFSPDGTRLVSGNSDGTAKIWPLKQLGLR